MAWCGERCAAAPAVRHRLFAPPRSSINRMKFGVRLQADSVVIVTFRLKAELHASSAHSSRPTHNQKRMSVAYEDDYSAYPDGCACRHCQALRMMSDNSG